MNSTDNTGFGNLKLVQSDEGFRYGIDAVLLADFADSLCGGSRAFADLGTGNGIIPLILSYLDENRSITGIELQREAVELAVQSLQLNGLEDRISFINEDICRLKDDYPQMGGAFDAVVTNPPYVPRGAGIENGNRARFLARQETSADLETFIRTGVWMLRDKGHLFMVHRPSRLVDILCLCRKYRLEPKDMRLVVPREGEKPNILLLHCVLGGGRELKVHPQLAVYSGNGTYSPQVEKIYRRG